MARLAGDVQNLPGLIAGWTLKSPSAGGRRGAGRVGWRGRRLSPSGWWSLPAISPLPAWAGLLTSEFGGRALKAEPELLTTFDARARGRAVTPKLLTTLSRSDGEQESMAATNGRRRTRARDLDVERSRRSTVTTRARVVGYGGARLRAATALATSARWLRRLGSPNPTDLRTCSIPRNRRDCMRSRREPVREPWTCPGGGRRCSGPLVFATALGRPGRQPRPPGRPTGHRPLFHSLFANSVLACLSSPRICSSA
jgi:hypothetical protein